MFSTFIEENLAGIRIWNRVDGQMTVSGGLIERWGETRGEESWIEDVQTSNPKKPQLVTIQGQQVVKYDGVDDFMKSDSQIAMIPEFVEWVVYSTHIPQRALLSEHELGSTPGQFIFADSMDTKPTIFTSRQNPPPTSSVKTSTDIENAFFAGTPTTLVPMIARHEHDRTSATHRLFAFNVEVVMTVDTFGDLAAGQLTAFMFHGTRSGTVNFPAIYELERLLVSPFPSPEDIQSAEAEITWAHLL